MITQNTAKHSNSVFCKYIRHIFQVLSTSFVRVKTKKIARKG